MDTRKKFQKITSDEISNLFKKYYTSLMSSFYESQSSFLTGIYKRYNSMETANIMLCFSRNVHLEIIRQREKEINFDISLKNFWNNFNYINKPLDKVATIVQITNIPKETVRRKIKKLTEKGFLINNKNAKKYSWNLSSKHKDFYYNFANNEISTLSKFTSSSKVNKNLFMYSVISFPESPKLQSE